MKDATSTAEADALDIQPFVILLFDESVAEEQSKRFVQALLTAPQQIRLPPVGRRLQRRRQHRRRRVATTRSTAATNSSLNGRRAVSRMMASKSGGTVTTRLIVWLNDSFGRFALLRRPYASKSTVIVLVAMPDSVCVHVLYAMAWHGARPLLHWRVADDDERVANVLSAQTHGPTPAYFSNSRSASVNFLFLRYFLNESSLRGSGSVSPLIMFALYLYACFSAAIASSSWFISAKQQARL